jgi:hypothetical protein
VSFKNELVALVYDEDEGDTGICTLNEFEHPSPGIIIYDPPVEIDRDRLRSIFMNGRHATILAHFLGLSTTVVIPRLMIGTSSCDPSLPPMSSHDLDSFEQGQ